MRAIVLALLLATPAVAQDAPPTSAALPAALPVDVAEAILARPDRFNDVAANLIRAHGTDGGITPEAIETAIALDRAFFRARALRPFLEADLDADGTLASAEIAARASVLSAPARARLMRQQAEADGDSDGTISQAELRSFAEAQVDRASRPRDEALLRAVAAFDANADGRTDLAEVTSSLQAVAPAN